jgi:hypothetical protein
MESKPWAIGESRAPIDWLPLFAADRFPLENDHHPIFEFMPSSSCSFFFKGRSKEGLCPREMG